MAKRRKLWWKFTEEEIEANLEYDIGLRERPPWWDNAMAKARTDWPELTEEQLEIRLENKTGVRLRRKYLLAMTEEQREERHRLHNEVLSPMERYCDLWSRAKKRKHNAKKQLSRFRTGEDTVRESSAKSRSKNSLEIAARSYRKNSTELLELYIAKVETNVRNRIANMRREATSWLEATGWPSDDDWEGGSWELFLEHLDKLEAGLSFPEVGPFEYHGLPAFYDPKCTYPNKRWGNNPDSYKFIFRDDPAKPDNSAT